MTSSSTEIIIGLIWVSEAKQTDIHITCLVPVLIYRYYLPFPLCTDGVTHFPPPRSREQRAHSVFVQGLRRNVVCPDHKSPPGNTSRMQRRPLQEDCTRAVGDPNQRGTMAQTTTARQLRGISCGQAHSVQLQGTKKLHIEELHTL
jgi:hypothetical protein